MVERGENAASEKKREIGRAGTKHFPEYSPPRRFKPLKPGLLPPNSNCKTVNIHTINCFAQFLTIFYNARIQNRWKDNVYGKLDISSGEDRGLISRTAAGNRALCICMERVLDSRTRFGVWTLLLDPGKRFVPTSHRIIFLSFFPCFLLLFSLALFSLSKGLPWIDRANAPFQTPVRGLNKLNINLQTWSYQVCLRGRLRKKYLCKL